MTQQQKKKIPTHLNFRPEAEGSSWKIKQIEMQTFILAKMYCVNGIRIEHSLREDRSVVYNSCWRSPAQSFLGSSPAGLMTTLYSLAFETSPAWRTMSPYLYPQGSGWPSYTPGHWVPFPSPPTSRPTTEEVFDPASTRASPPVVFLITPDKDPRRKHHF
jgi:hypothetical protein